MGRVGGSEEVQASESEPESGPNRVFQNPPSLNSRLTAKTFIPKAKLQLPVCLTLPARADSAGAVLPHQTQLCAVNSGSCSV